MQVKGQLKSGAYHSPYLRRLQSRIPPKPIFPKGVHMGRLRKAVDKSISTAIDSGNLDAEQSAAAIEMLRIMADKLDSGESMRNVPPASFLNYCDALGLTPDMGEKKKPKKPKAKMAAYTSSAKFAKAVNG